MYAIKRKNQDRYYIGETYNIWAYCDTPAFGDADRAYTWPKQEYAQAFLDEEKSDYRFNNCEVVLI